MHFKDKKNLHVNIINFNNTLNNTKERPLHKKKTDLLYKSNNKRKQTKLTLGIIFILVTII